MRCPIRSFVTLLALSIPGAPLAADELGEVRGTIVDAGTDRPIPGASILVTSRRNPGERVSRFADADGRFSVELDPGPYEVRVSSAGYATQVLDVDVAAGQATDARFSLTVEPTPMEIIVVSASRREEKLLDAPASVQTVEADAMQDRPVLTPADHLQARPAIDVARHGVNQGTVVVRGFNNAFSGATLTLVDNRIAAVPSLRYNALTMIPTANEDYERIEVVSGPGSALYGPNAANGAIHILTKAPAAYPGTTLSVAGGEQDLLLFSGRHAAAPSDRFAYKATAQYYQGTDFEFRDPVEEEARADAIAGGADPDTLLIGRRDFDVQRFAFEGRADVQLGDATELVANGGYNRIDNIELTGLGAAQAKDWGYTYGQARLSWQRLFVQGYVNGSDSEDTYLLRTGNRIIDKSRFWAAQAQHSSRMGPRQNFIYGVDGLFTRPDTDGTITGRNEHSDGIDEVGGYVHSETELRERWDLVLAARVDDHSELEDPVFSPRAAVVFEPAKGHKARATYNRAFSTPTTNNLFLDLVVLEDLGGFGAATGLGGFDVFTQGVPKGGFRFRRDAGGGVDGLYMEIPQAFQFLVDPGSPRPVQLPADATQMWNEALRIAVAGGADPAILGIPQPPPGAVRSSLLTLNATSGSFDAVPPSAVRDIATLKPTITSTAELGWKGIIGDHVSATADVYYSRIENFIGPLRVETPNVFFEPASLGAYLSNPSFGLSPAEVAALTAALARIPLGTVTPENGTDQAALLVTYRNFGDIDLGGVDLSLDWRLAQRWTAGVTYSWVSKDFFRDVEGGLDVALNAPQNKVGVRAAYSDPARGLRGGARYRFVDAFPVESGVYLGTIEKYHVVDVDATWDLPFSRRTSISVVVQNLLDDPHREFIGAPELRRLSLVRLSQDL